MHSKMTAEGKFVSSLDDRIMKVALLTGCQDRPYVLGLAMALASKNMQIDVIGSDEIDSPEFHETQDVKFVNFRGATNQTVSSAVRLWQLLVYYYQLICYATISRGTILHVLWNNRFEYFDRTILMLYYKLLRKNVALTAHNVNQARRDANDSFINRMTLRIQYRLVDHVFVHTQKMKNELLDTFGVCGDAVTVIRHPINNAFPNTSVTPDEAKRRLDLRKDERALLFLGRIRPYKGLEYLLSAFKLLLAKSGDYRLIVAGEPKKGSEAYLNQICEMISRDFPQNKVLLRIEFIPDEQVELYLKAADVMVLPYREIFQSGILFLSYSFGLPVIATDVGSFRDEIVEGKTGYLCKADDAADLARAVEMYFASDLYKHLDVRRGELTDYANANHSWHAVAELTCCAYAKMAAETLT